MGISLSTCWNAFRHKTAQEMIFEIKELGFEQVELSFNLTSAVVNEFRELIKERAIKITSVHNFCPIPDALPQESALPDFYSMSNPDEQIRQLSVGFTKRSIETAKILGAYAVVLHTGRVEIPDRTRELIILYDKGFKRTKKFSTLRRKIIEERKKRQPLFFKSALKSLDELNKYAQTLDIKLGIETRFYYREIPNFEEIGLILEYFKNSNIFYWHDTGHAQVMENLGFVSHKDFLGAYGKDILGFHLHNTYGCRDHNAPSKGEMDFTFLKPYMKENTLKVIEARSSAAACDLKNSRESLQNLFP